jgi:uncharacterized protein YydD (DUF2326 family)
MTGSLDVSPAEFVEYCHTQAALLAGRIETLGDEVDELLDELDGATDAVRDDLASQSLGVDADTDPEADLEAIEETQARVRAKQSTMDEYSTLAEGYTDLAERLDEESPDSEEALAEIVRFEAIHNAPDAFEDRLTVFEAATDED